MENTAGQNLTSEIREAKLNVTHIKRGTVQRKQSDKDTETQAKTRELDIKTGITDIETHDGLT